MNIVQQAFAENTNPPTSKVLDRLKQEGANIGAYLASEIIGLARISTKGSGFTFDPDGKAALITPVRTFNPFELEDTRPTESVFFGKPVDLLAWDYRAPAERFFLYRDSATWLGCVEPQYLNPGPVPIWRGPLGWLRAGCRGIVLLGSKDRERQAVLQRLASIEAEDPQHERELRRIAGLPIRTPEITARQPIARAA